MEAHAGTGRTPRREWLAALLVFAVLAAAMSWPLPARLGRGFAAPDGDFAFGYWNVWWTAEALFRGENPFYTRLIFHPDGISLLWRDFPFLATAAAAPVTRISGPMAAYNLIFLATLVLAGQGAFLLARYLTGSFLAGLGAGLAYGFGPLHFLSYSQQSSSHLEWLPFLVLALLRLRDTGRLRHGAGAGLWLAASLHSGLYYGIYAAFAAAVLGVWFLLVPGDRAADRRAWLLGFGACTGVSALLFAPRGIPMALEALRGLRIEYPAVGSRADLLGLLARAGPWEAPMLIAWPAVLGWVVCLGAVAAVFTAGWPRLRLWWGTAALFYFLALGMSLQVAGRKIGLPMPADLLRVLPLLSSLRAHHRALIVVMLGVAVSFAWCLRALEARGAARGGWSRRLAWALLILAAAEAWPRMPAPRENGVPPFYEELARQEGGALLSIPFDEKVASGSLEAPMFAQTVHHRPLVGGHTSRPDPGRRARLAAHPFLARFLAADPGDPTRPFAPPSAGEAATYRADLRGAGVEWVILQTRWVRPADWSGPVARPVLPRLNAATLLAPLWRGPAGRALAGEAPREAFASHLARRPWLHPSVVPFLEAVLGGPGRRLADGALAWRVPAG